MAWLWAALIWCGIQCPLCPQLPPLFRHVPPLYENEPLNVPPHAPGFRHTSAHVRALVKATSHREKEKGRKLVEASGLICGAGAAPALCLETRMVAGCRLTFCEMYPQMYPQTVPDTPPP